MEALGIVGLVCVTSLASLVLVLRFLTANHLTKSQMGELRAEATRLAATTQKAFDAMAEDIGNEKQRLTQLANRVR